MTMDFKDSKPIYLQIAEHICSDIILGKYPEEGRLPGVRDYAAEVEVNVNTVVRSYEWLARNEFIFNRRGLGYFVTPDATARIREFQRQAFFQEMLPELLRTMRTLGITMQEVEEYARTEMDKTGG